jgi:His/Glu/Gln/Arg/opine family amino acid ABC transporter permease subunit
VSFEFGRLVAYVPDLLAGVRLTILMAINATVLGSIIGFGLALARVLRVPVLSPLCRGYIEFVRATPLLVQVVWLYFVLPPLVGVEWSAMTAATVGLALNSAAYLAEIFRAGIQGVERMQVRAARVLGLSRVATYRYVILPQAWRVVLPPFASFTVLILRGTALASTIGASDLMRVGNLVAIETLGYFEVLSFVAIIYFILGYPIGALARWLGTRLAIEPVPIGRRATREAG